MTPTGDNNDEQILMLQLREVVTEFLSTNVLKPSIDTVETSILTQSRLANLVFIMNQIVDLIQNEGLSFDKEYLKSLPLKKIEERIEALNDLLEEGESEEFYGDDFIKLFDESSSKIFLTSYLRKEINWISVSILSASYLSVLVLMRAVFMLLICMATRAPEEMGMSNRIDKISFLSTDEQKRVKKLWRRLNGWAHPYGKWAKEICPIFIEQKSIYHPRLAELCLNEINNIIDLFLTIAVTKYELDVKKIERLIVEKDIEISDLQSFSIRIK